MILNGLHNIAGKENPMAVGLSNHRLSAILTSVQRGFRICRTAFYRALKLGPGTAESLMGASFFKEPGKSAEISAVGMRKPILMHS
jgi:hypothetical protein